MLTSVLLKVAWMWITPCGTTFFSFFLKRLLLAVAVACCFAIISFQFPVSVSSPFQFTARLKAFLTSCRAPSSWRSSRGAGLCACARWCACAARAPGVRGGGAARDSSRCP